jgi:hypothetical protein
VIACRLWLAIRSRPSAAKARVLSTASARLLQDGASHPARHRTCRHSELTVMQAPAVWYRRTPASTGRHRRRFRGPAARHAMQMEEPSRSPSRGGTFVGRQFIGRVELIPI